MDFKGPAPRAVEHRVAQDAVTDGGHPSGFVGLMRNRNYALLWASQAVSQLGDRFHWIAISLWVYAQTSSALSVSYAIVAIMIGPAVVGVFAGALVDRWNRKWTMIGADLVRAALVALIPSLMKIDIRLVYVDLFLISCATAFFRPAIYAAIQQSVPKRDLMPANAFLTSMETGSEIIGPILAGVLVQQLGYANALYIDAFSFAVSSALLLPLVLPALEGLREFKPTWASLTQEVKVGFRYILSDRIQLALFAMIFLAWWPSVLDSLQTPLAKGELALSDSQFGLLNSIWGVGYLASSLLLGWYGNTLTKSQLIVIGFSGWAISTAFAALSPNVSFLFVSLFWVGSMNIVLVVSLSSMLMEITPGSMLGRVLSNRRVAFSSVKVTGMLAFGLLADSSGVRIALLSAAVLAMLGVALGLILFPEILRIGYVHSSYSSGGQLGTRVASSRFPFRVADAAIKRVEDAYDPKGQRRLNWMAFVVLIIGSALTSVRGPSMVAFLATGASAILATALIRDALVGFRQHRGTKNLRQGEEGYREEVLGNEGRKELLTGPTSR